MLAKVHKETRLNLDFQASLASVGYHVACHQRALNICPKTKQIIELIPGTSAKKLITVKGMAALMA
jgi:glycerol-3-phosphate dehydrogenase subunit C